MTIIHTSVAIVPPIGQHYRGSTMLKIPQRLLDQLRCAHCATYLSCGPIWVGHGGRQLCDRCYGNLPENDKCDYVRQVGYETMAEMFIFPCRYRSNGCNYTFLWNYGNDHEERCTYKHNRITMETTDEGPEHYSSVSGDLRMTVRSQFDAGCVKLAVCVEGSHGNALRLHRRIQSQEPKDVVIETQVLVTLGNAPEVTHGSSEIRELTDNVVSYESVRLDCCHKCNKVISESEIFQCLFGHSTCKQCKGSHCNVCNKTIMKEPFSFCKNCTRGCHELLRSTELGRHEIDCEFNVHKCLVDPDCQFSDSLHAFKSHVKVEHAADTLTTGDQFQLTHKDRVYYVLAHEQLFKLKYFHYDDFVEFLVQYVGSNDNAHNYKYEIQVVGDVFEGRGIQGARCLGWNETLLGRCIEFRLKKRWARATTKFEARVGIYKVNTNTIYRGGT